MLATDGLWDVFTMKSVLKIARRCASAEEIVATLKDKVAGVESLDNTSVVAVRLLADTPGPSLSDDENDD